MLQTGIKTQKASDYLHCVTSPAPGNRGGSAPPPTKDPPPGVDRREYHGEDPVLLEPIRPTHIGGAPPPPPPSTRLRAEQPSAHETDSKDVQWTQPLAIESQAPLTPEDRSNPETASTAEASPTSEATCPTDAVPSPTETKRHSRWTRSQKQWSQTS